MPTAHSFYQIVITMSDLLIFSNLHKLWEMLIEKDEQMDQDNIDLKLLESKTKQEI